MSNVFDKFLGAMKLVDDDGDEEDFFDDEDEGFEDEKTSKKKNKAAYEDDDYEDEEDTYIPPKKEEKIFRSSSKSKSNKVVPIRQGGKNMEVCVIKPTSFEDAREITDTLLSGRSVILNLEGLNVEIAQRIIDFSSGSCYSMNGNLQKVSSYIFIITPETVEISGDFQELIGGSFDVAVSK
ncbi:MAG: cell division protein SepF [Lachnospiraceae bacterium]|mgnify:FL=1|uniref:cell division protein SepF n=1 Tax=Falcatimonas sp. MSJ-15 TaxID=2841515 RepID=UPI001C114291|nr:cell division protein SepF [Falcatimonas sp. MSJ-15]MBQ5734062.1 cell division protein SepF [Lachnospiraceae bacterium]MBU5470841.1 cell division protein SepF [Falcatimonas sp. MSJ-15]MEE0960681.1 cell division protein SepF [Lachnospiraceae bacterium]